MKKSFVILTLLFSAVFSSYSQKKESKTTPQTITNPASGIVAARNLALDQLELRDTCIILSFTAQVTAGNWIFIPKETYIQAIPGDEKLFVLAAEGIPLNEFYTPTETGEMKYQLTFPPLGEEVTRFDYGEANEGGNWHIYDICTSTPQNNKLPEGLSGNWFSKETGSWEMGLYANFVIYQSKVWEYGDIKLKKKNGVITLSRKDESLELFLEWDKNGKFSLGTSKESLVTCQKDQKATQTNIASDQPYTAPVFKIDSATYSGYIKGYTSRIGVKTLSISVNDIISGDQNSHVIEINEDGYFSIKLPFCYPSHAFVRSEIYNGTIYLEPGKEVFQLISPGKGGNLCMGASGKVNNDLAKIEHIYALNYQKSKQLILESSPQEYKDWCLQQLDEKMHEIDSLYQAGAIGAKAKQIKQYSLQYDCASNLMFYNHRFETAYRDKHKIPRSQRTIPVEPDTLPDDFYDFVAQDFANDPLALISASYDTFLNRLAYMDGLREYGVSQSNIDLVKEITESGHQLSEEELEAIHIIQKFDSLISQPVLKTYNEKYGPISSAFYQKYREQINKLKEANPDQEFGTEELFKALQADGIAFTSEEEDLLKAFKVLKETSIYKQLMDVNEQYLQAYNELNKRYSSILARAREKERFQTYVTNLENKLGVHQGLATDIIRAQHETRSIVSNMTPVSDKELWQIQKDIETPFIDEYIAYLNEATKQKIEANKLKTGFVVNETPKSTADKLFESIMEKYKGKVVYVDFWATWCGPCRSGIERIASLKEEMKDENVAFVYITSPSSPKTTWENVIPDIKGEHYRVSTDEWNYLCDKFNISGIPRYVLVGKDGKIINENLGHMDNNSIKSVLQKHM